MSEPGLFRVLRACFVAGRIHPSDTLVRLDDPGVIAGLLEAGKIAPADDVTAKRIKWHAGAKWSKGEPRDQGPAADLWVRRYPR